MVIIHPRQPGTTSSIGMSSTDMAQMPGMSTTMAGMSPTMTMSADSSSNGGLKLSPAVIAILAAIGGVVVSIFIGFWIHARIKEYKLRKYPHASQQVASASLSVSTYVGAAPSKVGGGTAATGSYSILDNVTAPPMSTDSEQKQPATVVSPILADLETRLAPQRLPGNTATGAEAQEAVLSLPAPPSYASHSYLPASSQADLENNNNIPQTNLSTPIISPEPVNLTPRSPSRLYVLPGGMPKADDSMSSGCDSATLAGGRTDLGAPSSAPPTSPRPLPRIPQLTRTVSMTLSAKSATSEQKGDRSFLTFDEAGTETHANVLQLDVADAVQRQPDRNNNSFKAVPSSGIRLMTVIMEYEPELPDELEVKAGDVVRMLREFDDGWCVVEHVNRSRKRPGAIPRMCLQERNKG